MKVFLTLLLSIFFINSKGQSNLTPDSLTICGLKIKSPNDCEFIRQGQIKCTSYAMSWFSEPVEDIERHKDELLDQMKRPKKLKCDVLGSKITAFKTKIDSGYALLVIGNVNRQGLILNLWLDKDIKTNEDLPNYLKQIIKFDF